MTAPKTPAGDVWPALPFAETTPWCASHVGRRLALEAAQAAEPLPAGEPFTGHPRCRWQRPTCIVCGSDWEGPAHSFALGTVHQLVETGCALAAGHTCPCRFSRRLG